MRAIVGTFGWFLAHRVLIPLMRSFERVHTCEWSW